MTDGYRLLHNDPGHHRLLSCVDLHDIDADRQIVDGKTDVVRPGLPAAKILVPDQTTRRVIETKAKGSGSIKAQADRCRSQLSRNGIRADRNQ